MREIKFRVWYRKDSKMYYRGYQKLFHVLLCENDFGKNEGKGTPVKKARYDDCEMMEGTGILDKRGYEIFEGDIIQIFAKDGYYQGVLDQIPDMFRSRGLHPLQSLLDQYKIKESSEDLEFEVLGNIYEHPQKSNLPPQG